MESVAGVGRAAQSPKVANQDLWHGQSERRNDFRFINLHHIIHISSFLQFGSLLSLPGALEYFAKGIHIGKVLVAVEDGVPVLPSRPQVIGPAGETCLNLAVP